MFTSIKMYAGIALTAVLGILYAIFSSTRKENKLLTQINKTQQESLKIVEVSEDVSTTLHKEYVVEKASIERSIEETKQKVSNETDINNDPLDPEFIRLLRESRD